MIVKMKKVTLLCLAHEKELTLKRLRKLGVLHLVHVNPPEGHDLDTARKEIQHAEQVKGILSSYDTDARAVPRDQVSAHKEARKIVTDVLKTAAEKRRLSEELENLQREYSALEPFGDFDPEQVLALKEKGIYVRLYRAIKSAGLAPPECRPGRPGPRADHAGNRGRNPLGSHGR